MSDKELVSLSLWREVQIVCVWSSWCHCIPIPHHLLPHFNPVLLLPFWYRLTQVVLEKRPLNRCSSTNRNPNRSKRCAVKIVQYSYLWTLDSQQHQRRTTECPADAHSTRRQLSVSHLCLLDAAKSLTTTDQPGSSPAFDSYEHWFIMWNNLLPPFRKSVTLL